MTSRIRRPFNIAVIIFSVIFILLCFISFVIVLCAKLKVLSWNAECGIAVFDNENLSSKYNLGIAPLRTEITSSANLGLSHDDEIESFPRRREFIRPIKIAHVSLNAAEKFKSTAEQNIYHHSGNFRRNKAKVWDPHPEYEFNAFGKHFHLMLKHDSEFAHPSLKVTVVSKNVSFQHEPDVNPSGCYYSGILQNEPQSNVIVSLCNGMTGHINSENGIYFIEPAEPFDTDMGTFLHTIYQVDSQYPTHLNNNETHCGILESREHVTFFDENEFNSTSETDYMTTDQSRKKRSAEMIENVVELMIVADNKMAEYHGSDLHNYILTLMSMVANIYKHKSIGNPMHITVVKLFVLSDPDIISAHSANEETELSKTLDNFCWWQRQNNNNDDLNPAHHDCALLLSREITCKLRNSDKCYDKLGLAQLGTMCQKNCCAIIRDNGLGTAFTIAHELGHAFNMPHDEDDKCLNFTEKGNKKMVMTRQLGQGAHPWKWSACSRYFLTEFLETDNNDACLHDYPTTDYLDDYSDINVLPGEKYTKDKQCELIYGKGYKTCSYEDHCSRLWCMKDEKKNGCHSNGMPVADGTPCGSGHWCQHRECVLMDRKALKPIHGDWGPWQPFEECTRSCGGGIKRAYRNCDNPSPKNGGKYCLGDRVKYQSCNFKECPIGTPDFRSQQCTEFNDNNFEIHNLSATVRWIPHFNDANDNNNNENCKLYCRVEKTPVYYKLQNRVIDGTPCGPNTYDMCVNGVCKKAGCDHKLNSTSVLDTCGICGGNNATCKQVHKQFNMSVHHGYNHVLTIPAGASNLDVQQRGFDENYLALVDAESNLYLLSGDYSIVRYPKKIDYEGVTLDYSGSNVDIERINTSRPLRKDLTLEVLSVGKHTPPDIDCRYTVPISPEDYFRWDITEKWSACNKVCDGEQLQIIRCARKDTDNYVSEESCSGLPKPKAEIKICNQRCRLRWNIVSQTECSSLCGIGFRILTYGCFQEFLDTSQPKELPLGVCSHIEKPSDNQTCNGTCNNYRWKYFEWQPCTVTCGSGVQTRRAVCMDASEQVVDDALCPTGEKVVQKLCVLEKCSVWSTGEWSKCSVTCGLGERVRQIRCQQGNRIVLSNMCSISTKPPATELCEMPPCAAWIFGEWSNCSVSCGGGMKTRYVVCQDEKRNPADNCNATVRPEHSMPCNTDPCHANYYWNYGEWSECNQTCGIGFQQRLAWCVDLQERNVSDIHCNSKISIITRECQMRACATIYHWSASEWSECSVTCGIGFQNRSVRCQNVSELEGEKGYVSNHFCNATVRPYSKNVCRLDFCKNDYIWIPEPWSECSSTCGVKGKQKRKLSCFHRNGKKVKKSFCKFKRKPSRRRKCTMNKCEPANCLEIKRKFKITTDQEYSLNILGRNISIYCHRMRSDYPSEYLTLPAGGEENFSEFFGRRLINPETCPDTRRGKHRCPCLEELSAKSGKTMFNKIRLNLTSLEVITKDLTFTRQIYGSPISLAEAGDCYSTVNCPQGSFSINLKGTGLLVAPSTLWVNDGTNASMEIKVFQDNRRVVGKCGGYCAACRPLEGLKLDVLPP